jgi:hypothetical protein
MQWGKPGKYPYKLTQGGRYEKGINRSIGSYDDGNYG